VHEAETIVVYTCSDGTPFPVTFAEPDDVDMRWMLDLEHAPDALSPLADAAHREGTAGTRRAYEDCGASVPSTLARALPKASGFHYVIDNPIPADEVAPYVERFQQLVHDHEGALGVWERHCLPRIEEACDWLRSAPQDTSFRELAERRSYVFSMTGVAGVIARYDLEAVAATIGPRYGEGASLLAYELAQGSSNATLDADTALAHVAHFPSGSPEADRALAQFLDEYGGRATSWPLDHPTLDEEPELVEAQLRLLRRNPHHDIAAVPKAAEVRQHALADEIRSRMREADERARFDRHVARLTSFVPVREGRAHWQLIASGSMRHAAQRRGRQLVEAGIIDDVGDVFYLTPSEYDAADHDLRNEVEQRRAEHERWKGCHPPTIIGRGEPDHRADDRSLRGTGAATGIHRGRACVIRDLVDADRLEPGDVLVATMTSPPWTPLFAIASAVVADSGDPMSHVAIAAREYGIPCVVGTDVATIVIRDGDVVTVDGTTGMVELPSEPRRTL
jgi:phosphohistidine swiveling domain-containing protein